MNEPSVASASGPPRAVRAFPAPLPDAPVVIASPPSLPEPDGSKWMTTVLPALSSFGIVGFALVSGSVLYVVLGIVLSLVGIGAAVAARVGGTRARRRRQEAARDRYATHLDDRHALLGELGAEQRRSLVSTHPDPTDWRLVLDGDRLWERRPHDVDFLRLRLGRGRVPLAVPIRLEPAPPAVEEEADLRAEAELLVALHAAVDDVPATVDLAGGRSLVLQGADAHRRPLLRAVIAALVLGHAPGEVQLVAAVSDRDAAWVARLPHTIGCAKDLRGLRRLLTRARDGTLVAVVDLAALAGPPADGTITDGAVADVAALDVLLAEAGPQVRLLIAVPPAGPVPAGAHVHVLVDPEGGLQVRCADGSPPRIVARPDALPREQAEQLAEALAAQPAHRRRGRSEQPVRLTPLLDETAAGRPLQVPLGRDLLGEPVLLDLAQAASGGDGPHGLLLGATGSGKSELLRSVFVALISRNSPAELAVVGWDFKGGAALAPFVGLPHLRAALTNLGSDPRSMQRAARSLRAELHRRQQVLAGAGVDAVDDLPATAAAPLPTLLLVVDEFSELLAAHPDLLDLFVSVGRLGRSLGIHLLLSSQRLDEGRLRGLDSQLRYRICLRTFSASDSQTILGTDAAFRLPPEPGSGLLSLDGRLTRFDGALADDLPTLIAAAADRWAHVAVSGAALWPPDLPTALALAPTRPAGAPPGPRLDAAIGLVDLPDQQSQVPLVLDLTDGPVAVVGAARSGRTTALATLVVALAAKNSAELLEMHVVTDDREAFAALADLPHLRSVLPTSDEETLRHLLGGLASRVRSDPDGGARRSVLLLIDDWSRLRHGVEECTDLVAELAAAGPRSGVHLVVTATGWSEFRAGLREHLASHLELRLGDPYESEHGKARAAAVPRVAGRAISPGGHDAQLALPRVDGVGPEDLPAAQREFVATVLERRDPVLPKLQPLPGTIALADLLACPQQAVPAVQPAPATPASLVLGVDADGLAERLDLQDRHRHLLVVGESGSGRTTALRTVLAQLPSRDVDLWVVDPRRTLLASVDEAAHYAYSPSGAAEMLTELARRLEVLRPPEGLSRRDLLTHGRRAVGTARSVVVIDDYDLLPGSGLAGPLGPLVDLLQVADDVGLSLLLARSVSPRVGYDPGWQILQESAATGLLLSGDPATGPVLGGVRPARRPPGRGLVLRRGRPAKVLQVAQPEAATRPVAAGSDRVGGRSSGRRLQSA